MKDFSFSGVAGWPDERRVGAHARRRAFARTIIATWTSWMNASSIIAQWRGLTKVEDVGEGQRGTRGV